MEDNILRQFACNAWANRRVARSLRTITGAVDRPVKLFAHVLNAERLWLSRIAGEAGPLPWDERTIDECERLLEDNRTAYDAFFKSGHADDGDRMIDYRTTDGTPYRTSLRDILQHVLMHGAYHRGQIATAVKSEGGTPASTDFILYVRDAGGEART